MPKKVTKKTNRKKAVKAEPMPSLIFGQVETVSNEPLPTKVVKNEIPAEEKFFAHYQNYQTNPTAIKWMWGAVTFFALVIVVIWGYAMQIKISRTDWDGALKRGIVAKGKNQWDAIFSQTEQQESLKKQITQAINQAALVMASSTNTINFTTSTVTSSTPNTTTTINTVTSTLSTASTTTSTFIKNLKSKIPNSK